MKKNKQTEKRKRNNLCTNRHVFYLNDEEHTQFLNLYQASGKRSESKFIASVITGKPIKIVKIDKVAMDYYIRLTNLYYQFQAVGTNYNQVVKALKTNFNEKRAIALLFQLEKNTKDLQEIFQKIIELTQKYEQQWLPK